MKKNTAIYAVAFILLILSFLSFNRSYREMQRYSLLTNRSVFVLNDFQQLLRLLNNAAIINPDLIGRSSGNLGAGLFLSDSLSICRQLDQLNGHVADSVNQRIAKSLDTLVRTKISWLLRSNVPDSILHHHAKQQISDLLRIDSMIKKGLDRTAFLFRYREEKLKTSINEVKWRITLFIGLACILLIYTVVNLFRQHAKNREKEAQLKMQENKFRALIEHSQDLVVLLDSSMNVLYRSPSAEHITGFTNEEREKNPNLDEVHPEDRDKIKSYLDEMKSNPGKVIPATYRLKHKLGHYIWLEGTFNSLYHDKDLNGVVINLKDVSERKTAELELLKSERRFRQTLENMMEGVQIIGFDWRYIYVNDSLTKYSTYKGQDMIGFTVMEIYPGVEKTPLYTVLKKCMEERTSDHLESEFVFPDGSSKYFELSVQPVPEGIFILSIDISERKKTEDALQKNIKELSDYKYAIDESSIVAITDQKGIIHHVNDNFCKISGYEREELIGQDHRIVNSGYHSKGFIRSIWTTIANGHIWKGELRNQARDGSIYWVDTTIIPFLNSSGKPYQYLAIRSDITERKKAEEEHQKTVKELSDYQYALNESSIVAITDQKGTILHVNDNFCKISGYEKEKLIGQDHRLINSGYHGKEFIRNLWKTIANGHIWKGELKNRAQNGSIYWVNTTIIPFLNTSGKPYQYVAIRNDITERKRAEEEITKLNRLYAFLSAINQSIVHIDNPETLFKKACNIAVEIGGFKLARVDLLDEYDKVRTVSISGDLEGIREVRKLPAIDYTTGEARETPTGRALSTGIYAVNNDMLNDPTLSGTREKILRVGVRSGISLPVKKNGKIIGVFNLSSSEENFFDHREIDLLLEAAGDISFALENFEKAEKHKIAEEQVISNERRFRALIEKSTDLKTLTSSSGLFVYASPSISTVFGYAENEIVNQPAYNFFHPDDVQDLLLKRTTILDTPGASFNFRYRILHKKGHWIWCDGTLTNMLHEPSINALVSNFRDISEIKTAQEQKEFDKNNLDSLINNTNDLLWSLDKDFRLITFNRPFYEVIKMATGKELSKGDGVFTAALSEEHERRFRVLYGRALAGEAFTEIDVVEGEGGYAAEISFYPMRRNGEIIGTACYSRDVSLRLKQEKEREKMITDLMHYSKNLEQFGYIVSHNLRSPVANIIGLCNLLNGKLTIKDKTISQQHLVKAVTQLDVIVRDLNTILEMRSTVGQSKETVNLSEIVQGIMDSIYETMQNEQVRLELDFQATTIVTVKTYMYSIFYNLITNSIKYKKPDKSPVIRISSQILNGEIVIRFRDNGMGMNLEEYGPKVFGLYQRFHMGVSGKGMGLYMVKTQVESLEGTISVTSVQEQGSEFIVRLPLGGLPDIIDIS